MKWNDLNGEERLRVLELVRKGETPMTEICETFGVTRQTLNKAMRTAQEAMKAALEPKTPGRKEKSEAQEMITALSKKQSSLEKDVDHWKTRYEVAQAYIDLVHKQEDQERKNDRNRRKRERKKEKKKPRSRSRGALGGTGSAAGGPRLAVIHGGPNAGDTEREPGKEEEKA